MAVGDVVVQSTPTPMSRKAKDTPERDYPDSSAESGLEEAAHDGHSDGEQ